MSNRPEDGPILSPEDIGSFQEPGLLSGCWKVLAGAGGCVLLFLVILGIAIVMGLTTLTSVISSIAGIFSINLGGPVEATVRSPQTIVQSVRPLGHLVSVSAQVAKADIDVEIREGFPNLCGFSASHVAVGTIEAGVDLSRITEDDITINELNNTITIILPPVQVTSCRIDDIRQYDRSYTPCRVDWDGARRLAQYTGLSEFYADAIEGGILQRASDNTHMVLSNFLELSTGRTVNIQFRDDEEPSVAPSCRPQTPDGWVWDEEDSVWRKPG